MEKALKGWPVRHLLALSVALNVGLVTRLAYDERTNSWSTERNDVVCAVEVSTDKTLINREVVPFLATAQEIDSRRHEDDDGRTVNLDHGDPTMYEKYWQQARDKTSVFISGWQSMSYFSDLTNLCWFLDPHLAKQIVRLHRIVGNAVTIDRHIVVGTGSTQLLQAALYALSSSQPNHPISVVSATPYYSFYKQIIEYQKSGLYRWAGDVSNINVDEPYIELVTSPNNPDGFMRQPLLNRTDGLLVHDFAYYWPQYTPMTSAADHHIMLFTLSKTTGHAGMRIGWALVKDKDVAKKMVKFIELNSIGVSKDSQLRAAKILQAVSDSTNPDTNVGPGLNFFEFNYKLVSQRWKKLREAVKRSGLFTLPEFASALCNYSNQSFMTQPAFAWLKCEGGVEDCDGFFRKQKILTRSGRHFGVSPMFVRISMLDRDANFELFIKRLSMIRQ